MRKLSLISILAGLFICGCGTRPKGDSISVDNRGNCKEVFVRDYEKTESLLEAARENGIGEAKLENREREQAALDACAEFKNVHQNNICKVQDRNGDEEEWKAKDLNEVCEYFANDVKPDATGTLQ